jgi:hypothetical protein
VRRLEAVRVVNLARVLVANLIGGRFPFSP